MKHGGKEITAHDLRRTFASFAERAGVPHTALKVLLNHAFGGDVTIGYVRPSADDLRHWAAQVERAIIAAAQLGTCCADQEISMTEDECSPTWSGACGVILDVSRLS